MSKDELRHKLQVFALKIVVKAKALFDYICKEIVIRSNPIRCYFMHTKYHSCRPPPGCVVWVCRCSKCGHSWEED